MSWPGLMPVRIRGYPAQHLATTNQVTVCNPDVPVGSAVQPAGLRHNGGPHVIEQHHAPTMRLLGAPAPDRIPLPCSSLLLVIRTQGGSG